MAIYKNFKGLQNSDGDTLTNNAIEEALYVNGVLAVPDEDGVIKLASKGTYTLKGRHYGTIEIGAASESALTDDTYIILDGVEIYADDETAFGIYYASTSQSLYVTLARNKKNTIICNYSQAMASNQGACLFSENNMVVQGSGYLSAINKGGHGVRASELRISGNPHIYVEAIHDGIHGNSSLIIDDGFFFINGANDAFGTGTSGSIHIFGGQFRCYNIAQNVFDSKVSGYYYYGIPEIETDCATIYSGVTSITPSTHFGTGSVKVNNVEVTAVEGVYDCTSETAEPQIDIAGYIVGTIEIKNEKANVTLNNAYIAGNLTYTLGSSNMQVNTANDTVNMIVANSGDALTSSNNMKIEVKGGSHLLITSTDGCAISASELTIHDSNGSLIVYPCDSEEEVVGTDIYIADSADHKTFADEAVGGYFKATKVYARKSSKGKKANITIKNSNLVGCACVNTFEAELGSTLTTGINLDKSVNVFYKKIKGSAISNIPPKTYEPFDVIPCGIGAIPLV